MTIPRGQTGYDPSPVCPLYSPVGPSNIFLKLYFTLRAGVGADGKIPMAKGLDPTVAARKLGFKTARFDLESSPIASQLPAYCYFGG
jgi:hypothetical protein